MTPTVGSGRRERTGRGSWGRWLGRRGQGHTERRRRRLLPLPPVGAPSRALIGAAAAAGRVSAASLRDATPSNCGRDRRYAAASCPGARPGRPRPRPAPAAPGRPAPPPPGRSGTLRQARAATASAAPSPAEAGEPSPRVPRPHAPSVGGHLSPQQLELGAETPSPPVRPSLNRSAGLKPPRRKGRMEQCFEIQSRRPTEGVWGGGSG